MEFEENLIDCLPILLGQSFDDRMSSEGKSDVLVLKYSIRLKSRRSSKRRVGCQDDPIFGTDLLKFCLREEGSTFHLIEDRSHLCSLHEFFNLLRVEVGNSNRFCQSLV